MSQLAGYNRMIGLTSMCWWRNSGWRRNWRMLTVSNLTTSLWRLPYRLAPPFTALRHTYSTNSLKTTHPLPLTSTSSTSKSTTSTRTHGAATTHYYPNHAITKTWLLKCAHFYHNNIIYSVTSYPLMITNKTHISYSIKRTSLLTNHIPSGWISSILISIVMITFKYRKIKLNCL